MLRWRLSLGALLIPALAWLFWLDMGVVAKPGSILFPLSVLVTLLASGEFIYPPNHFLRFENPPRCRLLRQPPDRPCKWNPVFVSEPAVGLPSILSGDRSDGIHRFMHTGDRCRNYFL